eukprot:Colp12_sorted_trinity150504_noHs@18564
MAPNIESAQTRDTGLFSKLLKKKRSRSSEVIVATPESTSVHPPSRVKRSFSLQDVFASIVSFGGMRKREEPKRRTVSLDGPPRRVSFNQIVTVAKTFSPEDYVRTCDLRPVSLAELRRIRQELLQFKLTEMVVAEESRDSIHIFPDMYS